MPAFQSQALKQITHGSVCPGIEAAVMACHPLGMRATWFAEIEPFSIESGQHQRDFDTHRQLMAGVYVVH